MHVAACSASFPLSFLKMLWFSCSVLCKSRPFSSLLPGWFHPPSPSTLFPIGSIPRAPGRVLQVPQMCRDLAASYGSRCPLGHGVLLLKPHHVNKKTWYWCFQCYCSTCSITTPGGLKLLPLCFFNKSNRRLLSFLFC